MLGGNKNFWNFMKEYQLEKKYIEAKYQSAAARFYKKRLTAIILGKEFT